jgi:hypothetical protein
MATVISRTTANLHLVPARVGEGDETQKVLLPFSELRLGSEAIVHDVDREGATADSDISMLLSATVPLENLAFILVDLAHDLRRMCNEVVAIGQGDLAVDPERMQVVRFFVAHLERQARNCRIQLDRTYPPPPETEE